jgi:TetR/AcrR family transcriptional regulator, regulator of cefoperazone and chloramphenicol sensitivity
MNMERLNESVKGRRKYDSQKRRAQAEETRRQIAEAARQLFVERGWAATRVRDVAAAAGVSEATVFSVHGNKAGLAKALLESVNDGADIPGLVARLRSSEGDPSEQLAALVAFDRRLFETGYDVIVLMREAQRAEPDLGAAYEEGRRRGSENRQRVFGSWPAGALREGLDARAADDIFAAMCNVDVYRVLVEERGWTADRVEEWWLDALTTLLLA